MNRRGLLGGILAACVAPAFIGSKVLMPVKTLWQPSTLLVGAGHGLQVGDQISIAGCNNLMTISRITQEALLILENQLTFAEGFNLPWPQAGSAVTVRRPARYA